MDVHIDDLSISYTTKKTLLYLGFINASELSGHDYFSLLKLYPDCQTISKIVEELTPLGYLIRQDSELSIYNVPMSKRLQNTLKRNHILYLSQLSTYPEETILQFRNLGSVTMTELKSICKEHKIHIRTLAEIKGNLGKYKFSSELYYHFFNYNITTISEFKRKTSHDLYNICNRDYLLTMKTYYLLKQNNIELKNQNVLYLFEILPYKKARILWEELHIKIIEELYGLSKEKLLHVRNITPNVMLDYKKLPKEQQLSSGTFEQRQSNFKYSYP